MQSFEVHTSFTNTLPQRFVFTLDDLAANLTTASCAIPPLRVLDAVFHRPDRLKPTRTPADVTREAAFKFADLSKSLREAGHDPEAAAHFLMRVLFCLFAEDVGMLPNNLFTRLIENTLYDPAAFAAQTGELFAKMAGGGYFGTDRIPHFNGGLFTDSAVLAVSPADTDILRECCRLDWSSVEPSIFGTLFERSLDPAKRSQLGAQYTSREDIELIVDPVLMEPLRRRWQAVQVDALRLVEQREAATAPTARTRHQQALTTLLLAFQDEIASTRVLDPACGSGNFLYVSLKRLLDLEHEVSRFAARNGLSMLQSRVGPEQLYGIEIDAYAHELAQVVVWIGYIQWLRDNGMGDPSPPILRKLDTILHQDAILHIAADGAVSEPAWPAADVIVGNPPFLGGKRMRKELGDTYVDHLFRLYDGRVPREADLVTYWFERSRAAISAGPTLRAGLIATNSIRGGPNRRVLQRIKDSGDIFMAWSNRPSILNGAAVRVSMVGFDASLETARTLDGRDVVAVNADLTSASADVTTAHRLRENLGLAFMGDTKGGAFDIPPDIAAAMLAAPLNPNGKPNSDVVRPWVNGLDIVRRPRGMYIIDFGTSMTEFEASLFEAPFAHVVQGVKPARATNNRAAYRDRWWIHVESRPAMRAALAPLCRFAATPTVARHRLFIWLDPATLPDHQLIAIARDDDYLLGVLHSSVHELWSLRKGTWLGVGDDPRYTPTTTFETFPFPWPPGQEPQDDPRVQSIAEAAKQLDAMRANWLNPAGAAGDELKKRTLTNLYNQRPAWLQHLHTQLDAAVINAYGWPAAITDDEILERLLALNLSRTPA